MNDNLPVKHATIADAPKFLNTNDKAFWVAGWNDCAEEIKKARAAIERQSVPAGSLALDAAIGYIERHTPHLVYSEIKAALAAAPQPQPERCKYCDGTGDVHSITGEWRGVCDCEAGKAQPQPVQPTNCRHCGGPENVLCAGQCGPAKGEKQ